MKDPNVAAAVREARNRAGMSQVELAERVPCTQSEISRIESGERSVSLDRLCQIARALGVEPAALLGTDAA